MTSKFEQLIEYVINDEEGKARELFHDIVVEKSREIYENLMNEEDLEESKEEEGEEDLEESKEEEGEEDLEESLGGDASDDLIDDVETEEQGMCEDGEEEGEEVEFDAEEGEEESGEDLEDRVVDLEDKLDELMAEFEAMMGGDEGSSDEEELEIGAGGDALEMDDTEEFTDEGQMGFMEGVDLKSAPAPVKSEEAGINKKSTTAFNSGAAGMAAKPVSAGQDGSSGKLDAPGAYSNKPKDMGSTTSPKQGPATKPTLSQASGVNTKSPVPKA